ncbi:MAG: ferredoxin reductase, partial [Pseudomonas sp.]
MMKVKIERIVDEALDIRSFRLVRSDGQPLDSYEPGAHVDLTGPTGVTRQYSLCSPPHDGRAYLVAVKKEAQSRGGSLALHEQVQEGMELEMGAPRNLFRLDPEAPAHALFAAGIGVTPLLSMAYRLADSGQPWRLHYFARSAQYAAFTQLLADTFGEHVQFHYGVEPGALDAALSACLDQAGAAAHVYTCGPAPFMH